MEIRYAVSVFYFRGDSIYSLCRVHDGIHIMLMQVGAPLQPGTSFPLTPTFENAGTVEVMVKVMGD